MNHRPRLKASLISRLVEYCSFLEARRSCTGISPISSGEIAKSLDIDESQIRKDLAAVGVRGTPRVGYRCQEVVRNIRQKLGLDRENLAVIVGAGRLGGALACYGGFENYGLRVIGVFDSDPRKAGTSLAGFVVEPMERLESVVRRAKVSTAVLAVPSGAAAEVAQRLVLVGVRAIWCFAPIRFSAPDDVVVRHQHLSAGLAELAYHLRRKPQSG